VGTKAVNALSDQFEVTSFREKKSLFAQFKSGELKNVPASNDTNESNGTKIRFTPDSKLFPNYCYDLGTIRKQLWNYAYLNRKLTITLNGEKFKSENGLLDLLKEEVSEANLYDIVHCQNGQLEMALTHTEHYGEEYFSYVNGHHTNDGGTHLSAFREGILKGANQFFNASFDGPDVRDGLVGAVAIKVQEPIFESQTKNKLGNSELRSWLMPLVRDTIVDFLYKHPEVAEPLKQKIQTNERIRKELNNVKKAARENAKKSALTIPNLKDCKFHLGDKSERGDESTVFITEGMSAGGSMISSRDVYTQAVFCLKGKPHNCYGQGKKLFTKILSCTMS
jgi:topoisomerase-4 subunit B